MTDTTPPLPKFTPKTLLVGAMRLCAFVVLVVGLIVLGAYVFVGTPMGSQFVLQKIATQTGIKLRYSKGNLREGVWVQDVVINEGESVEIFVDEGYIQMGWRALFARQVHLAKAQIGHVKVINHAPPTNEPFDYKRLSTNIPLRLQDTQIQTLVYEQATKPPVSFYDVSFEKATWQDTKVKIEQGQIGVKADDEDRVFVDRLNGTIDFEGDYPINAQASVVIRGLDKHYMSAIDLHATGTLKRTTAKLSGYYNTSAVTGQVVVQGLDEHIPIFGQLSFEELDVPYAQSQAIHLKQGVVMLAGDVRQMDLRINTQLSAKDIPNGHYHGRATLMPNTGLDIHHLSASTPQGALMATGQVDWQKQTQVTLKAQSTDFDLHNSVPKQYAQYAQYLPKTLNGTLDFEFKNSDIQTVYDISLKQHKGETINATISQDNNHDNKNDGSGAWRIHTNWQEYAKVNLPTLGDVKSPVGRADIILSGDTVSVVANARIDKLHRLPQGDYVLELDKTAQDLVIKHANYQGAMGDLTAQGKVWLATDTRPLSYDIKATTNTLRPNQYVANKQQTPIDSLSGTLHLKGQKIDKAKTDELPFELRSDLTATLQQGRRISLIGEGDGKLILAKATSKSHTQATRKPHASQQSSDSSPIKLMNANFNGRLITQGFAKGLDDNQIALAVSGNERALDINKLTLSGQAGHLSAGGKVELTHGINWRLNVHADELDTQAFYKPSQVKVSGDFVSVGSFNQGKLGHTTAQFDGKIATHNHSLPSGDMHVDIVALDNKYTINRLDYKGVAGVLSAKGFVQTKQGFVADIGANMRDFDMGYFIKNRPSQLTGEVAGFVDWRTHEQTVDVRTLNIAGVMNDEPVAMTGTLSATLNLPKDIKGYFASLKRSKFDLKTLSKGKLGHLGQIERLSQQTKTLQTTLADNNHKIRRIIKSLKVNDVMVVFGDNSLGMTGDEHKLAINIDAQAISQIFPTMRGQAQGSLILIGDDNSLPTIYSDLSLANISMPSFALKQGLVLAKVVNLGNASSSFVVQGVNVVAMGQTLRELRVDMTGTQTNHQAQLFVNDGKMQLRTQLQGGLDGSSYKGVLGQGQLETRHGVLSLRESFEFFANPSAKMVRIAPHCWQTASQDKGNGSLCLTDELLVSANGGSIAMRVNQFDMAVLTPILPKDMSLNAKINGKINATWGKKSPHVDVVLYSDNGKLGLRQEGLPDTMMGYERLSLIAQSVPMGLKLRLDVKAGDHGDGYADILLNPYKKDKPIKGAVALSRLNLAIFKPFFPAMRTLSGELNVAGGVGGSLSKPLFHGTAMLTQGQLALIDAPIHLTKINLTSIINGTNATLQGGFASGEGVGELGAVIDWQQKPTAKLSIQGDRLEINRLPLLSANISPHLEVVIKPTQKFVDIKGVISVPSATIRPPQNSSMVVEESPDVTVIDRRIRADIQELLAKVVPWSINADIGVDLGDEVVFRGFGARLPLAGALHLTQNGQGVMQAKGVVQVSERTKVEIIGQKLELNYGQIRFDGDIKAPRLSIEAVRNIDNQTVGMRVKGTPKTPMISVFNDAGLSDEQAMNALATGRLSQTDAIQLSEQGFRSQVTNSLAAAGLSLGLKSTHGLTNELGRALGLESLVVDASGGNNDTNINVTGYVSPDLYIRYGVGVFNAKSTLSMRYQLTGRVYVEATTGIERIVDVVYRWRF